MNYPPIRRELNMSNPATTVIDLIAPELRNLTKLTAKDIRGLTYKELVTLAADNGIQTRTDDNKAGLKSVDVYRNLMKVRLSESRSLGHMSRRATRWFQAAAERGMTIVHRGNAFTPDGQITPV